MSPAAPAAPAIAAPLPAAAVVAPAGFVLAPVDGAAVLPLLLPAAPDTPELDTLLALDPAVALALVLTAAFDEGVLVVGATLSMPAGLSLSAPLHAAKIGKSESEPKRTDLIG